MPGKVIDLASRRPQVVPARSLPDLGMRVADIVAARIFAEIRGRFAELTPGIFGLAVHVAGPLLKQAAGTLAEAMGETDPEEVADTRSLMVEQFDAELRRLFAVPDADDGGA